MSDAESLSPSESPTGPPTEPAIQPWLREILRCPVCRGELRDEVGPAGPAQLELVCTTEACRRAYRVDDGIPVLLPDEARLPA